MRRPINEQTWHHLTEEILSGMREWRSIHPKAPLRQGFCAHQRVERRGATSSGNG